MQPAFCPGHDDRVDGDGDTVPDGCDVCAGHDDRLDNDGDGVPNGCDICNGHDDGADADAFDRLAKAVAFPLYGGECYAYGLLASGHADLAVEADMEIYDYLSHVSIVSEAGGVISEWDGRPLGLESGPRVIAAGDPDCHRRALALLQGL